MIATSSSMTHDQSSHGALQALEGSLGLSMHAYTYDLVTSL